MKANNIRLMVNDFDGTFNFYSEIMGFEIFWGSLGGDYASFKVGDNLLLSIFKMELMDSYLNVETVKPVGSDKFALILECDSVDDLYKALNNKGVKFLNEPKDKPGWGMRCVHLRDNEGNLIEIYQALPKEKWDKELLNEDKRYNK